jgi:hypothetical protein
MRTVKKAARLSADSGQGLTKGEEAEQTIPAHTPGKNLGLLEIKHVFATNGS